MKFRKHQGDAKVDLQMASMIDIVFQLLIFFILTLKIIPPEGDFNINMPTVQKALTGVMIDDPILRIRLEANQDGSLKQLYFGELALGNSAPEAFDQLSAKVGNLVSVQPLVAEELEVEIISDYILNYRHVVAAMSACRGRVTPDGKRVTYLENIKFAPIKRPSEV